MRDWTVAMPSPAELEGRDSCWLTERIPREAITHQHKLPGLKPETPSRVWKLKIRYLGVGRTGSFWRLREALFRVSSSFLAAESTPWSSWLAAAPLFSLPPSSRDLLPSACLHLSRASYGDPSQKVGPTFTEGVLILTSYICKDPVSTQGHILRFWADTNLGEC